MFSRQVVLCLTILASVLSPIVLGSTNCGSTFVTDGGDYSNSTFSVNLPQKPDEPGLLKFYISGPRHISWIGFGFGKQMDGALMFIAYPNAKGKNLTFSTRLATSHSEPSYSESAVNITIFNGTGVFDDRFVIIGMCKDCRKWKGGSLDYNSTAAPMIYAFGPDVELNSNSYSAGLRRHAYYGHFSVNMTAAGGDPDLFPSENCTTTRNAVGDGPSYRDHEYSSGIHAVLMAGTFVILLPLGILYLKIFERVRWHWMNQCLGVAVIIVGAVFGLSMSKLYNRSKHYNSPHQVIGLVLLLLVVVQAILGATHHRVYQKNPRPTTMSHIHRYLGPLVILLGLANGGLGFSFASQRRHIIGYAIIIILVLLVSLGAYMLKMRRKRREAVYQTPAAQNFQSAYVAPQYQNDIPLAQAGAPPPYSRPMGL